MIFKIKKLINALLTSHWITKILGQFNQKDICLFIHEMLFKIIFSIVYLCFGNYNNLFKYIIE